MIPADFANELFCSLTWLLALPNAGGGWMTALEQSFSGWARSLGPSGEAVFKLGLAALLGGAVGLEREIRGHEAGFRTFMLVCAGAALAMIVSMGFGSREWVGEDALPSLGTGHQITVDPARIAYGVMTGVGFLGAGTIIQRRGSVQGLTTAAGIWSVAALGLAVGFGMFVVSIMATVLLILTLLVLGWFRSLLPTVRTIRLRVRAPGAPDCVERFSALLREHGMSVGPVNLTRRKAGNGNGGVVVLDARVKYMDSARFRGLRQALLSHEEYRLLAMRAPESVA